MRVRFWGTRGSVPTPGSTTLRYGGNTSCVEVRAADGTLVILDCGTGAIGLGRALLTEQAGPIRGALLIGHTHWDHIQGFPFFAPLFVPGNQWEVYGPEGLGQQLERSLKGQMAYEYFPLGLEDVSAQIRIQHLREGVLEVGSIRVTTQYLNHPVFTLGYRLEADGASVVYATDYEPFWLHGHGAAPGTMPLHPEDRRHIRFLEGAALIIHDAQYALEEFPAKTGWGHMPMERAVDYALLAQAQCLALFHHDPVRADEAMDGLCARAQERVAASGGTLQVYAAAEGQVVELPKGTPGSWPTRVPDVSALSPQRPDETQTVLLAQGDAARVSRLEEALCAEGLQVVRASDGESALQLARQIHPGVIVLEMTLPGLDGLGVCRALRAEGQPCLSEVPILMLSEVKRDEADLLEALAAGATDFQTTPVKATLIRSRVRSWLQRTAAGVRGRS